VHPAPAQRSPPVWAHRPKGTPDQTDDRERKSGNGHVLHTVVLDDATPHPQRQQPRGPPPTAQIKSRRTAPSRWRVHVDTVDPPPLRNRQASNDTQTGTTTKDEASYTSTGKRRTLSETRGASGRVGGRNGDGADRAAGAHAASAAPPRGHERARRNAGATKTIGGGAGSGRKPVRHGRPRPNRRGRGATETAAARASIREDERRGGSVDVPHHADGSVCVCSSDAVLLSRCVRQRQLERWPRQCQKPQGQNSGRHTSVLQRD